MELSQHHFRYLDDGDAGTAWQVPVLSRGDGNSVRTLLTEATTHVDFGAKTDVAVVNAGGWGFYRVQHSAERLRALVDSGLSQLERFNLVSDVWAIVLSGRGPLEDFVEVIELLRNDDDPNVWAAMLQPLPLLDRVVDDDRRDVLRGFVRRVAGPAFAGLGWDPAPDESDRTSALRAALLGALGIYGADPDIQREAAARHASYLEDRTSLHPDLVAPVISIVAQGGGEAEYTTFLTQFRAPATPQEQIRYLYGMAEFPSRPLMQRTLDLAVSEVRTQNAPFLINVAIGNRVSGDLAWDFVKTQWDPLAERFPHKMLDRMITNVMMLIDRADDVHSFFADHPIPTGQKQLEQTLERLDIHAAFARRASATAADALS
jgi:aminopeptidase N